MAFDRRKMRFEVYKTPEQKAEEAKRPPRRRPSVSFALMAAVCMSLSAAPPAMPDMGPPRKNKRGW